MTVRDRCRSDGSIPAGMYHCGSSDASRSRPISHQKKGKLNKTLKNAKRARAIDGENTTKGRRRMRREAKRGSRGAWVTEAVLDAGGAKWNGGKMATHLRCHRHLAEDESALAETSVSAAGFSSPRLPVRRSCMGLLRTENDHFILFSILPPRNPRKLGFHVGRERKRKKKRGRRTVVGGDDLDSSHIGGLVG
jgi:hypothetical protein